MTGSTRKKRRGGGIVANRDTHINDQYNLDDSLNESDRLDEAVKIILQNPDTEFEYIPTSSIGGFLIQINIAPVDQDRLLKLTAFDVRPVEKLLMKLIIIDDNNPGLVKLDFMDPAINTNNINIRKEEKEIITSDVFDREFDVQRTLYNLSYDEYLEPICPCPIVKSLVPHNSLDPSNSMTSFINYIKDSNPKNEIFSIIMETIQNHPRFFSFGVIIMEHLNTSKPVEKYFNRWSSDIDFKYYSDHVLSNDAYKKNRQVRILSVIIYELLRLWELGYIHGDTHIGNFMYVTRDDGITPLDYDYIDNIRVYLIDFGRTRLHGEDRNITADNLQTILKNIFPTSNFWSYQLLKTYVIDEIILATVVDDILDSNEGNISHYNYKYINLSLLNDAVDQSILQQLIQTGLLSSNIPHEKIASSIFMNWYSYMNIKRDESKRNFLRKLYTLDNNVIKQSLLRLMPGSMRDILNQGIINIFSDLQDTPFINDPPFFSTAPLSILKKPIICGSDRYIFDENVISIDDGNGGEQVNIHYFINIMGDIHNKINISYTNTIPKKDGSYTFVIYLDESTNKMNIVFYLTHSVHEIGTKHACIMYYSNITNYYSAGELRKTGTNIEINYLSGTFMMPIANSNFPLFINICEYSSIFIHYLCDIKNYSFNVLPFEQQVTFIDTNLPVTRYFCDYINSIDDITDFGLKKVTSGGRMAAPVPPEKTEILYKITIKKQPLSKKMSILPADAPTPIDDAKFMEFFNKEKQMPKREYNRDACMKVLQKAIEKDNGVIIDPFLKKSQPAEFKPYDPFLRHKKPGEPTAPIEEKIDDLYNYRLKLQKQKKPNANPEVANQLVVFARSQKRPINTNILKK